MKAYWIAFRLVVAGIAIVFISATAYRAGLNARCRTGNVDGPSTADNSIAQHTLGQHD